MSRGRTKKNEEATGNIERKPKKTEENKYKDTKKGDRKRKKGRK